MNPGWIARRKRPDISALHASGHADWLRVCRCRVSLGGRYIRPRIESWIVETERRLVGYRVGLEWCAGLRVLRDGGRADHGRGCMSAEPTPGFLHVVVDVGAALLLLSHLEIVAQRFPALVLVLLAG